MANIKVPYKETYSPRSLGVRPAYGFFVRHVKKLKFHNVSVDFEKPDLRPAIVMEDVDGVVLNQFEARRATGSDYDVILNNARNFTEIDPKNLKILELSN